MVGIHSRMSSICLREVQREAECEGKREGESERLSYRLLPSHLEDPKSEIFSTLLDESRMFSGFRSPAEERMGYVLTLCWSVYVFRLQAVYRKRKWKSFGI